MSSPPKTRAATPDRIISSEAIPNSSPIKQSHAPIKGSSRSEWSQQVYPRAHQQISCDEMFNILVPVEKRGWVKSLSAGFEGKMPTNKKEFRDYLNMLSRHVGRQIHQRNTQGEEQLSEPDRNYFIDFRDNERTDIPGHPTGTACRPDVVGLRKFVSGEDDDQDKSYQPGGEKKRSKQTSQNQSNKDTDPVKEFCLGHVEVTGEVDSGKGANQGAAQAAAYVAFHSQTRPDLKMALGFYVKDGKDGNCQLFAVNACVVYKTKFIGQANLDSIFVLYGWMWRIYVADRDESLSINYELSSTPPTFTLNHNREEISNLSVIHAGETIGRRTIVMKGEDSSGQTVVVKEQYIEVGRRFEEDDIIKKIHSKGQFPGVIGLVSNSSSATNILIKAKFKDGKTVTRKKTRLILDKSGDRLSEIRTPREVLMAIYDALEVSRILFKRYKIFHRDYSQNNILLVEELEQYMAEQIPELEDMCFSQFLLDQERQQTDPGSMSSTSARLATRLLLIDFDFGEDRDKSSSGGTMARTGTPIFMARRVRGQLKVGKGAFPLPPMPNLEERVIGPYQAIYPKRLEAFPPMDDDDMVTVGTDTTLDYHEHRLRYEAESLFWNLLYWCMTVQPDAKNLDYDTEVNEGYKVKLPSATWQNFTGPEDRRDQNFISAEIPTSTLHPGYAPLHSLLDNMRRHLRNDVELSKDPVKDEQEYLHEVFQRLILNFLAKNRNEPFMDLERSSDTRQIEGTGYTGTSTGTRLSTRGVGSSRQSTSQSVSSKRQAGSSRQSTNPTTERKRSADQVSSDTDGQSEQPTTKRSRLE